METKFDNEDRLKYNGLRVGDTVNVKNQDGSIYTQAVVFDYGNKSDSIILIGKSQKPFDWISDWCDVIVKVEDSKPSIAEMKELFDSGIVVVDPNVQAFEVLKSKSLELANQCKSIKVTDDVSEGLAVQIISKSKMHVKDIDNKRVELKEPSLQEGRAIDKLAKDLSTPLSDAITAGNTTLLTYKQDKEKKRKAEIQRIDDLKTELEFYCTTTRKEIDSANTEAELLKVYNEKIKLFPTEYAELGVEAINEIIKGLITHGILKRKMILNPVIAEEIKAVQEEKAEVFEAKLDVIDIKAIGKVTAKATGINKKWRFQIIDSTKLPRAWLMADEKVIETGMKSAVEKEQLKDGDDKTINGVRFYQEEVLKNIR